MGFFGNDPVTSFLWRAYYGTVSPYDLDQLKKDTAAEITRASGGQNPAAVQAQIDQANAEVEKILTIQDAHPGQASGLRLPTGSLSFLKSIGDVAGYIVVGGIVLGVLYFGFILTKARRGG